ncbi:MAG TPA: hypothetical protein VFY89_01845 [Ktedonobacterales bacterium]
MIDALKALVEQAEKLSPERQEALAEKWRRELEAATQEPEALSSPLFQIAGMFAIGEPGWADRHDEAFADMEQGDGSDE